MNRMARLVFLLFALAVALGVSYYVYSLLNKQPTVVEKTANKVEIAKAIEEMYKVDVESVNTMNYGGGKAKAKYTNKGVSQQRIPAYKKAIVTLAEGDSIDFFSGI